MTRHGAGSTRPLRGLATPVLFGEVGLMLWLLIVGARGQAAAAGPGLQAAEV